MPKQKVTYEEILVEALRVFKQKSYYNASMADIAGACGILKGSLYHYFESKEELMRAVIRSVHDYFKKEVFSIAVDETQSYESRLRGLLNQCEDLFIHREDGYILGNIGVETALVNPEFSEDIRNFFTDFVEAMKIIFESKYSKSESLDLAERSVAELEGAIMLSRIFQSNRFLLQANERIIARIKD